MFFRINTTQSSADWSVYTKTSHEMARGKEWSKISKCHRGDEGGRKSNGRPLILITIPTITHLNSMSVPILITFVEQYCRFFSIWTRNLYFLLLSPLSLRSYMTLIRNFCWDNIIPQSCHVMVIQASINSIRWTIRLQIIRAIIKTTKFQFNDLRSLLEDKEQCLLFTARILNRWHDILLNHRLTRRNCIDDPISISDDTDENIFTME